MRSQHTTDQGKRGWWYCINLWQEQQHKILENGNTPTIEYAIWRHTIRNKPIHIIGKLPSTIKWRKQYNKWDVHQWHQRTTSQQVTSIPKIVSYWEILIFHIEDITNADAVIFNDTMRALRPEQHISGPTHVKGNTLDLIFTWLSNSFVITNTTLHGFISDHCMVSVNINIKKQKYPTKTKKIRDRTKNNWTPPLLKTSQPQNSMKTKALMKPAVNLTWNCSMHSMQLHPSKASNSPTDQNIHVSINSLENRVVKNCIRSWRKDKQQHQWQVYTKERNVCNRLLMYHKKENNLKEDQW